MDTADIRISNAIVHILDSMVGMPVLSDTVLDHGSDFGDFLKNHIIRIIESDDKKSCSFEKEESAVYPLLEDWDSERFISASQEIAKIRGAIIMMW